MLISFFTDAHAATSFAMSAANVIASVRATTKKVRAKKVVGAAHVRSAACFTRIAHASEVTLLVDQHSDGHISGSGIDNGERLRLDQGN